MAVEDPNYTYQWFDCDTQEELEGATNFLFQAGYTGSFAVRITDARGCKGESECSSVIVSSLDQIDIADAIEVFPNPSSGLINVVNPSGQEIKEVIVYNLQGRTVARVKRDFNKIDLSENEQGVYLLKIVLDRKELVREIILSK